MNKKNQSIDWGSIDWPSVGMAIFMLTTFGGLLIMLVMIFVIETLKSLIASAGAVGAVAISVVIGVVLLTAVSIAAWLLYSRQRYGDRDVEIHHYFHPTQELETGPDRLLLVENNRAQDISRCDSVQIVEVK